MIIVNLTSKLSCRINIPTVSCMYFFVFHGSNSLLLWNTQHCCGSLDKTTDSQSGGSRFESAGSGSSAP